MTDDAAKMRQGMKREHAEELAEAKAMNDRLSKELEHWRDLARGEGKVFIAAAAALNEEEPSGR